MPGGGVPDAGGGVPDAGGGVPDAGGGVPDAGGGVPDAGGGVADAGGASSPGYVLAAEGVCPALPRWRPVPAVPPSQCIALSHCLPLARSTSAHPRPHPPADAGKPINRSIWIMFDRGLGAPPSTSVPIAALFQPIIRVHGIPNNADDCCLDQAGCLQAGELERQARCPRPGCRVHLQHHAQRGGTFCRA